jgi:hypothetical protein
MNLAHICNHESTRIFMFIEAKQEILQELQSNQPIEYSQYLEVRLIAFA